MSDYNVLADTSLTTYTTADLTTIVTALIGAVMYNLGVFAPLIALVAMATIILGGIFAILKSVGKI